MITGRKPKPSQLKLVTSNPGKRQVNRKEAKAKAAIPAPPHHLTVDAVDEWNRVATELFHLGILSEIDRAALAAYAMAYDCIRHQQDCPHPRTRGARRRCPSRENGGMKLIRPTTITDAMLTSSTAPENDHPVWASGTAYAVGARVILTATHRRYEALVASTGVNPASDPTKWLDLGPTNTIYFVLNAATNTFQVAATSGGVAIGTSGTQSGTHTCFEVVDVTVE